MSKHRKTDEAADDLGREIAALAATIEQRSRENPDTSYTASLLEAGKEHCARKVGEEALELVIALLSGRSEEIGEEAADLCYHLLVALKSADVGPEAVAAVLKGRKRP